jgi:hypothetical protein
MTIDIHTASATTPTRDEAREFAVMREMMALFGQHHLSNGEVIAVCTGIVLSQHYAAMEDGDVVFAQAMERAFHAVFDQMVDQRKTKEPPPVG